MARPFLQIDAVWWHGPAVRRLSDYERARLVDILFLMNQGDEIGVLTTGGVAWSSAEAARAIGLLAADDERLVDRLIELGAIQRDNAGRIACSWMVADADRRERLSLNGKKGGNPMLTTNKSPPKRSLVKRLVNQEVNQRSDSDSDSDSDSPGVNTEGGAGGVRPRGVRKPDPIWDTVVELWWAGKVIKSQSARCGRVVKDFKELEATVDEIRDRYQRMRDEWGDKGSTPESLVKHWAQFGPDRKVQGGAGSLFGQASTEDIPARIKAPPDKYDNLKIHRDPNACTSGNA